jgi:hypothetical protein
MIESPKGYQPSPEEIAKVEEEIHVNELEERKKIEEVVEKEILRIREENFEYGRGRYRMTLDSCESYKRAVSNSEGRFIEEYSRYGEENKNPSNQLEYLKKELMALEKDSLDLSSYTQEDFVEVLKKKPKELTTDKKGKPLYYSSEVAFHGEDKTYTWPDIPPDLGRKLYIYNENDPTVRRCKEKNEVRQEAIKDIIEGFSREALEKGDLELALDGYAMLNKLHDSEIDALIKEKMGELRKSEKIEDKKKFLAISQKLAAIKI